MPATGADFDALVQGGDRPGISAAAGAAREADAVGVHLRSRAKIVERANAVPGLDARGRVTA